MKGLTPLLGGIGLFLGLALPVGASLERMEADFQARQAALEKRNGSDVDALQQRFTASLQQARTSYKERGDLEAMLAVDAALERVKTNASSTGGVHDVVDRMERRYREQLAAAQRDHRKRSQRLRKAYEAALAKRIQQLVAKNQLDDALLLEERMNALKRAPDSQATPATSEGLSLPTLKIANRRHIPPPQPAPPSGNRSFTVSETRDRTGQVVQRTVTHHGEHRGPAGFGLPRDIERAMVYWPPLLPGASDETGEVDPAGILVNLPSGTWMVCRESSIYGRFPSEVRAHGGATFRLHSPEVHPEHDLMRFRLSPDNPAEGLPPAALGDPEKVRVGDRVAIPDGTWRLQGRSQFLDVSRARESQGAVEAVGPVILEIGTSFQSQQVGWPILNEDYEVVGIASHASAGDAESWVTKGSRFTEDRFFGLRIDDHQPWKPINDQALARAGDYLSDQSIATVEVIEFLRSLEYYVFRDQSGGASEAIYPVALIKTPYPLEERRKLYRNPRIAEETASLYRLVDSNKVDYRSSERELKANYMNLKQGVANRARSIDRALAGKQWPTPRLAQEADILRAAARFMREATDKALQPQTKTENRRSR